MKMYFKVEGSNEIHVVNNLTGSITKEKYLNSLRKNTVSLAWKLRKNQ